jgi:hypothetical protein
MRNRDGERQTGTVLVLAFFLVPVVRVVQISSNGRVASSQATVKRGESQRAIEEGSSNRMRRASILWRRDERGGKRVR